MLIVAAGLAGYANSFRGPFVFDDVASILDNPSIRHLSSVAAALSPPSGGLTVSGRPLLNLSFALNLAASGFAVWSYHALNLAIHLAAGLTLYGLARRTPRCPGWLPLPLALLWTVHPLQTEAVTYVAQRAESLMGFFYLFTLYAFARSAAGAAKPGVPIGAASGSGRPSASRSSRAWLCLSVIACLCGMATKEVMVSAPAIALLYDRTFLSGSFREAVRRHWPALLGLAATWVPLACLVAAGGGSRSGSVGFNVNASWWSYVLTQPEAIMHYLRLAVWPHPLIFEYGVFWAAGLGKVWPGACAVLALVVATFVALKRWPRWGFLGFWFFAILAPTTLVAGTTQMIVEHRMYLALAPLLAAMAAAIHAALRERAAWLPYALAAVCVALTFERNRAYRSELALWSDTVANRPQSALAHNNYGAALAKLPGHGTEAIRQYEQALTLDPNFYEAYNNLGNALLAGAGQWSEAVQCYRDALRINPQFAEAHADLGNAYARRPALLPDAIAEYETAIRLKPGYAGAYNNLGSALLASGRVAEAVGDFAEALRLRPDFADAHNNLGKALAMTGRLDAAVAEFQAAIALEPDLAEAHNNLGNAWSAVPGRQTDAEREIETALRLKPDFPEAHNNLGNVWASMPGRLPGAIAEYRQAVRLDPAYAAAHFNLALALLGVPGAAAEARAEAEAYIRLQPHDPAGRRLLAEIPAP